MKNLILALLENVTFIAICEKDVASQLTRDVRRLRIIRFDGQTAYIKLQTHWQKISRADLLLVIRNLILPEDRFKVKSKDISEVAKRLSEDISLRIEIAGACQKQQYLINFLNGVLNIATGEFTTDRSKWLFDYVINANYNENYTEEDCQCFTRFIITSAGVENKECILISIGYGISSLTDVKKVIIDKSGFISRYLIEINDHLSAAMRDDKLSDELLENIYKKLCEVASAFVAVTKDLTIFKSSAQKEETL